MFGWINQFLPLPKGEQGVARTQHHALGGEFLDAEALIGVKQAERRQIVKGSGLCIVAVQHHIVDEQGIVRLGEAPQIGAASLLPQLHQVQLDIVVDALLLGVGIGAVGAVDAHQLPHAVQVSVDGGVAAGAGQQDDEQGGQVSFHGCFFLK